MYFPRPSSILANLYKCTEASPLPPSSEFGLGRTIASVVQSANVGFILMAGEAKFVSSSRICVRGHGENTRHIRIGIKIVRMMSYLTSAVISSTFSFNGSTFCSIHSDT